MKNRAFAQTLLVVARCDGKWLPEERLLIDMLLPPHWGCKANRGNCSSLQGALGGLATISPCSRRRVLGGALGVALVDRELVEYECMRLIEQQLGLHEDDLHNFCAALTGLPLRGLSPTERARRIIQRLRTLR
jgi:hypothetical protein